MIDIKKYKNLCKISNSLLKKNLKIFTISNNFLNIVKEHPLYLRPYSDLSYSKSFLFFFKYLCFTFADFFLVVFYTFKNLFVFSLKKKINHKKKKNINYFTFT